MTKFRKREWKDSQQKKLGTASKACGPIGGLDFCPFSRTRPTMTASAWSARTQRRPWRPALAAAPWFESKPKVTSRATTSSGWESTTRPELSTDTRSTTPTSTTSTATCTTGRKVTTYEIRLQSNSTWARILLILFHSQL